LRFGAELLDRHAADHDPIAERCERAIVVRDDDARRSLQMRPAREPTGDRLNVRAQPVVGVHVELARIEVALREPAGTTPRVARVGRARARRWCPEVARRPGARGDRCNERNEILHRVAPLASMARYVGATRALIGSGLIAGSTASRSITRRSGATSIRSSMRRSVRRRARSIATRTALASYHSPPRRPSAS